MDEWQTESTGPSEGAASASAGGEGDGREERTSASPSAAGSSASSDAQPSTSTASPPSGGTDKENMFECNICLDSPTDPVVSLCGHLFCWACLHGWLEMRPPGQQSCPVCKAGVTREKVVPLYGRNSAQQDPRKKPVPPRPRAQRTEAPNPGLGGEFFNFPGFGGGGGGAGGGGFHVSVGLGMFPFTFISAAFNGANVNAQAQNGVVSQVFLWLAVLLIIWIIFY